MKLVFDANQDYQIEAINTIISLFSGQPTASSSTITIENNDYQQSYIPINVGISNNLTISEDDLLKNCQQAQQRQNLQESPTLEKIKLLTGEVIGNFPNFTIEMETGTGKTYVYLRTIFELNKVYGFKKFVIVVPSVAIRQGVLSSLKLTKDHFQTLYQSPPCEFNVYESGKTSNLRQFAISNAIQILVIGIDSFAKDIEPKEAEITGERDPKKKNKGNVINQVKERGMKPIEFIRTCNPIVILDEPQNLETDTRKKAIANLNPLCTLRFSATHKNIYNLIYKLDPVKAFELGLVKQIGVDSVIEDQSANNAYIELVEFVKAKKSVSAKVVIDTKSPTGTISRKTVTVRPGNDLFDLSGRLDTYKQEFIVNFIDAEDGFIQFANDIEIRQGRPNGALTEEIQRAQIARTVERHFKRELELKKHGIKVLSLFFIDQVNSYRIYNEDGSTTLGKFAQWFEEEFNKIKTKPEYANLYNFDTTQAHDGYFSQDKQGKLKDSTNRGNEDDIKTYDLIMNKKEELLDPQKPLRFIFSHSALREGWDNPNVFQICVLREIGTQIERRQTIGRGLRLCVNSQGNRVRDTQINRLTVIANESYEDFAKALQKEMEESGVTFKKSMIQNDKDRITIRLKKGYETDQEFIALWEKIKHKTRYKVAYRTDELIKSAVSRILQMPRIDAPKIWIKSAELKITTEEIGTQSTGERTIKTKNRFSIPDLPLEVQERTGLSRSTITSILLRSGRLNDALQNPQKFIEQVSNEIEIAKKELLVNGIEYEKIQNQYYEMRLFEDSNLVEEIKANVLEVNNQTKTLFSHIIIDSQSAPELEFAKVCESNENVLFYIKLPKWFEIDTPVGAYRPDWAVVYKNDSKLYFVAETKGSDKKGIVDESKLRPDEQYKIKCGRKHFAKFADVEFKVVGKLEKLIA